MSNVSTGPASRDQTPDGWSLRRIGIAGASGATLAGSRWILDFWTLGPGGSLGRTVRGLFELSQLLFPLPLAAFVLGSLIAAGLALWHRRLRKMGSGLLAILAIPGCFVVVNKVPSFGPWLCYAMANSARFEALATNHPPSSEPAYAVIEGRDVSVGLAGDPNHFVFLIYDDTDAVDLAPFQRPSIWRNRTTDPERDPASPIPKGRRLYGHFFRVDEFE